MKSGEIKSPITASNHCPVKIILKNLITADSGETVLLREQLMMPSIGTKKEPPRLCAKHWEECMQKQVLLPNFFKKQSTSASDLTPSQPGIQSAGGPDSMGTPTQKESTEPTTRPKSTP